MNSKTMGRAYKMAETIEVCVEQTFRASPERVFDAWLEPDLVTQWMSAALKQFGLTGGIRRVEIDARVGGRFTFSDMREAGETVHWGTYLEIDRPRRLVFTWYTSDEDEKDNTSVVTLTIKPKDKGCIATIVHTMDHKYTEYILQTEQGWSGMLVQIDEVLE